jgi:hypothetical protein
VGYPGLSGFAGYIKRCQVETTFYFADVNDRSVEQMLRALRMKVEFAVFVEENQGKAPAEIQQEFARFWDRVSKMPTPQAGAKELVRQMAVGV